jgi:hypothetical protein
VNEVDSARDALVFFTVQQLLKDYCGDIGRTLRRAHDTAPRVRMRATCVPPAEPAEQFAAGCKIIFMYYKHIAVIVKVRETLM